MAWRLTNWCEHKKIDKETLSDSIKQVYNIFGNIEYFHPILTIFIKNNFNNKRLNNRYQIVNIKKIVNRIDRNVKLLSGQVRDHKKKKNLNRLIISKESPLVPLRYYNIYQKQLKLGNQFVNTYSNYMLSQNFNSINNSAYIEIFISYLTSNLYENKISPHFPLFYGTTASRFKKFTFNLKKSNILPSHNYKIINKDNKSYIEINNFPVQLLFFEKINNSLFDLLEQSNYEKGKWMSIVFQVCAALNLIQHKYEICHNDLHVGNIMYSYTKLDYLYYQHPLYNNKVYCIPTYGKIFKIIDWGRGTLKYKDKFMNNNVFYPLNSAGGQYYVNDFSNSKNIEPNRCVDINFFIFSLLKHSNYINNDDFIDYLESMCIDNEGVSILNNEKMEFSDYINISHNCNFFNPQKLINSTLYKKYIQNKKDISHLYSLQ